jgi:hypothetical protein
VRDIISKTITRCLSFPFFCSVEFATLTLDTTAKHKPKAKIYRPSEIDALLVKLGLGKKDEDVEMRT